MQRSDGVTGGLVNLLRRRFKNDFPSRWLRRMDQIVSQLDISLAGRGHCISGGCDCCCE
jgi:hypothetical protein